MLSKLYTSKWCFVTYLINQVTIETATLYVFMSQISVTGRNDGLYDTGVILFIYYVHIKHMLYQKLGLVCDMITSGLQGRYVVVVSIKICPQAFQGQTYFSALVQGFEDLIKLVKELTDRHTEMNDDCM